MFVLIQLQISWVRINENTQKWRTEGQNIHKNKEKGKIFLYEYTHSQISCPLSCKSLESSYSSKFSTRKCISLEFDLKKSVCWLIFPSSVQMRENFRVRNNLRTFLLTLLSLQDDDEISTVFIYTYFNELDLIFLSPPSNKHQFLPIFISSKIHALTWKLN